MSDLFRDYMEALFACFLGYNQFRSCIKVLFYVLLQDQRPHTLYMHKVSGVIYILHPDKCGIHFRSSLFAVRVSCLAYIHHLDGRQVFQFN